MKLRKYGRWSWHFYWILVNNGMCAILIGIKVIRTIIDSGALGHRDDPFKHVMSNAKKIVFLFYNTIYNRFRLI